MNDPIKATRIDGEQIRLDGTLVCRVEAGGHGGAVLTQVVLGEGLVRIEVQESCAEVLAMYGEGDSEILDETFEMLIREGRREDAIALCREKLEAVREIRGTPLRNRWREREEQARALPQEIVETRMERRNGPSYDPRAETVYACTEDPDMVQLVLEDGQGRTLACNITRERMRALAAA